MRKNSDVTLRVEVSQETLSRLFTGGQVCAAEFRCLDCQSRDCLWRICLDSCADNAGKRTHHANAPGAGKVIALHRAALFRRKAKKNRPFYRKGIQFMQNDIKCTRCQAMLSDEGFIRLKNMVRRDNAWFVMCTRCSALNYLSKLNSLPSFPFERGHSAMPRHHAAG